MSDDSEHSANHVDRRTVLKAVGVGALTVGGIGTASAAHGEKGGNSGGGGPPEGHGPGSGGGGGNRPEGRGPSSVTGGSGLMLAESSAVPTDPDAGTEEDDGVPEARFELGTATGGSIEWWTGCEAAGDPNVPLQTFKEYPVNWLDGDGPGYIYIYQKKPVNPGTYNMVESEDCSANGEPVAKVGYEPAGEGHGEE